MHPRSGLRPVAGWLGKAMMPGPDRRQTRSPRRRASLNTLGTVILILGLNAAAILYGDGRGGSRWQPHEEGSHDFANVGKADGIPLENEKRTSRDLERYYGKVGALAVNGWSRLEGMKPSESIALTVAAASLLAGIGCFFFAKRPIGE